MSRGIAGSLTILMFISLRCTCGFNVRNSTYVWSCNDLTQLCEKSSIPVNLTTIKNEYTSHKMCRLTCGNYASLWPKPTITTRLAKRTVKFHPSAVTFECDITDEEYLEQLRKIQQLFLKTINRECGNCSKKNDNEIKIAVSSHYPSTNLYHGVDESYVITINKLGEQIYVKILSKTIYGARHALETFSQLIVSTRISPYQEDTDIMLATVDNATIIDRPMYLHRGLLLDTARNYLPIKTIKRQIDAMGHSKLNVLHWHATDSQSFPLKLPSVFIMATYGAYSAEKVYTDEDIVDLRNYAKIRGVRIILEIDAPAHAGNGWQWGSKAGLGDLAVCVNKEPWPSYCIQPPCGQLNPANENLYTILGHLYGDIIQLLTTGEMFHMGGDEVHFGCWNASVDIINYLKDHGKGVTRDDFLWLWSDFQKKAVKLYDRRNGNNNTDIILWSSALTDPAIINEYLNKNRYIIQTWVKTDDALPTKLLDLGYRLILSTKNAWYLDHGFWGSTPYYPWRVVYKNELPKHIGVLGGEVCMWGELVDESSIDSRIWPRAAAAAERLWSDPDDSTAAAEPRFYQHRDRLVDRGIRAEALAPNWCIQNEGQCL